MSRRAYLYRASMFKNGTAEPTNVYLYARNKDAAKVFCRAQFGKFDRFEVTKFGETELTETQWPACFIEEDGEQALVSANMAANGEKYAERRS